MFHTSAGTDTTILSSPVLASYVFLAVRCRVERRGENTTVGTSTAEDPGSVNGGSTLPNDNLVGVIIGCWCRAGNLAIGVVWTGGVKGTMVVVASAGLMAAGTGGVVGGAGWSSENVPFRLWL